MTREEAAIKSCEDRIKHLKSAPTHHYGKRQRERAIELEKVKIKALRPVNRERVEKFKEYFDDLYGKGLEVYGWHLNGEPKPFDDFYEDACKYAVLYKDMKPHSVVIAAPP